jgi:hypothetical protein
MTNAAAARPRPRGRLVLALVYAVLGIGAWVQAFINLFSHEPRALVVFHVLLAITGTASAVGGWSMARWASIAAALYGIVTASLLLSLTSILKLDPSVDGGGLKAGAAIVLAFSLWAAWYLRRTSR